MAATNKKRGRPSSFRPEFEEQARKLAMLGLTDVEMAKFFGVAERTFHDWKKAHPEFLQALNEGKEIADADVAMSLYRRATGYSHEDAHVSMYQGEVTITPLTKHYPPDPTAMIFWLKNRQPSKWRDKPNPEDDDTTPPPVKVEISVRDARVRDDDDQDESQSPAG